MEGRVGLLVGERRRLSGCGRFLAVFKEKAMNRLALIATLVTLSAPALAASGNDTCKKISAMAAQAMEARQKGDLLEDAMSSVGDQSKFSEAMVMKAYKVRVFESSKGRATAIAEFQNAAYRECYDAFN